MVLYASAFLFVLGLGVHLNRDSFKNIITPKDIKYTVDSKIRPYINFRNEGFASKDSVYVYGTIYDLAGNVIYRDTAIRSVALLTTSQQFFEEVTLDSIGEYVFEAMALKTHWLFGFIA